MCQAPELRRGCLESEPDFGSSAVPFAKVDDPAILLLAIGKISQDDLLTQAYGSRQSQKAAVGAQYKCSRGVLEEISLVGLALHDDGQLRRYSPGSAETWSDEKGLVMLVHHEIPTGPQIRLAPQIIRRLHFILR